MESSVGRGFHPPPKRIRKEIPAGLGSPALQSNLQGRYHARKRPDFSQFSLQDCALAEKRLLQFANINFSRPCRLFERQGCGCAGRLARGIADRLDTG